MIVGIIYVYNDFLFCLMELVGVLFREFGNL